MATEVKCPHCGHVFTVETYGWRGKRLKEILDFIEEEHPTVEKCVIWIMKKYKVRRVKALEYIRDLAETGEITVVNFRLVPAQKKLSEA
ncbi:hypothetical protein J7K27_10730 [Candidatus Bathyarchaeota archaeon]|nr:hypothetical protein [Candidatus Bathyarchaeota archaeon]